MKNVMRVFLLMVIPVLGFSQGGVRFTEKYGPSSTLYEQENDFTNRKFIPYAYVDERDVMWKRVTWEIIDLREKRNLPLYYPTDTIQNRINLINLIMKGIQLNQFTAFKTPLKSNAFEFDPENIYGSYNDVADIGKSERIESIEISPGVFLDSLVSYKWKPEEIKQLLVKSVWYFDRKDSRLRNEIIGVCPIREYIYNGELRRTRLFWVYYPDLREYMSTVPVFSMDSDKPLYSFDDMFVFRHFSGYFIEESNVYNDRLITDYVIGREAQLESQRIRNQIFNYEQDLWEN